MADVVAPGVRVMVVRCGDSVLLMPTFREVWATMPVQQDDQAKRRCYQCNQRIAPGAAMVQWIDGANHLVMQEHVRCPG